MSSSTQIVKTNDHLYERIDFESNANPVHGHVRWSPSKSIWWIGCLVFWLSFCLLDFSWGAVAAFRVLTPITLCLGHSIGMHRLLIHRSFETPKWLEMTLVYLGTLVGMGGPFSMMKIHDARDWAQRNPEAHDFFTHKQLIWQDFWWQLHCKLDLERPPEFQFPPAMLKNRFYHFLDRTMMLQQLPLALALFAMGGIGWVAWGIAGRVAISLFGHWLVGYFSHNQGQQAWEISSVSAQGFNVKRLGLITFGECWHHNHHAFPRSAKMGFQINQRDPSWIVIQTL